MSRQRFSTPNLVEKLFITSIATVGIGGFVLFYAAFKFPSPFEGPWATITTLMTWLIVIVLLLLGVQLEGIKREINNK